MKNKVFSLLTLLALPALLALQIYASSQKAYQDYLFQSDLYRKAYNEFTVAKNEYEKFKSLGSQSVALEKTKAMLTSRNSLLRSYLLLLSEKLVENPGIASSQRTLYLTLLGNEVAFLEGNSSLVPGVGSLEDAQTVSTQLESHYNILSGSMYQAIGALTIGNLQALANSFDRVSSMTDSFIRTQASFLPPTKRATLDRWLLQIDSKRGLYQQKVDAISAKNAKLDTEDLTEMERQAVQTRQSALEAKQYLAEGASFLGEVISALKFEE